MKHNYSAVRREITEEAITTKTVIYILIIVCLVIFTHITERDNHPFNEPVATVKS